MKYLGFVVCVRLEFVINNIFFGFILKLGIWVERKISRNFDFN